MTALVVRNSREGDAPQTPPTRDDGALYRYCMYFDGFKYAAYADDPVDLLTELIPGYEQQDEQTRLVSRITLAVNAQLVLQAQILGELSDEQDQALSEQQCQILTGPRFEQPRIARWQPPVTLVLVETGYAPYTDIPLPESGTADPADAPPNIVWLRPLNDWVFLLSLAAAGHITLLKTTDR